MFRNLKKVKINVTEKIRNLLTKKSNIIFDNEKTAHTRHTRLINKTETVSNKKKVDVKVRKK